MWHFKSWKFLISLLGYICTDLREKSGNIFNSHISNSLFGVLFFFKFIKKYLLVLKWYLFISGAFSKWLKVFISLRRHIWSHYEYRPIFLFAIVQTLQQCKVETEMIIYIWQIMWHLKQWLHLFRAIRIKETEYKCRPHSSYFKKRHFKWHG